MFKCDWRSDVSLPIWSRSACLPCTRRRSAEVAVQGGHMTLPEAVAATPAWVLLGYLVAGVCFILARSEERRVVKGVAGTWWTCDPEKGKSERTVRDRE